MDYNEYLDKVKAIDAKSIELFNEKKALQDAYIEEHAEFKVGDKVTVDGTPAIVAGRFMSLDIVNYDFKKIKKDGTPSRNTLYQKWNSTVKKIEE